MISGNRDDKNHTFIVPVIIAMAVLLAFILCIGFAQMPAPGLYISEVCPHNDDIIYDSIGSHNDYIVVTNSSDDEADLKDYALSDDGSDLGKFSFPHYILKPGDSVTVWACEQTVFGEEGFADDGSFYTGFGLKDHEMLFLSDPKRIVIDSLKLPNMKRDEALLRDSAMDKGAVGMSRFLEDDPYKAHISDAVLAPVLSGLSGFYEDAFDLSMDGSGSEILYTLDGSDPYTSGVKYSGPVRIEDGSALPNRYASIAEIADIADLFIPQDPVSKAVVVRAVCKSPDGLFSKETVATYFVGSNIHDMCTGTYTVSIVSDPDGLFSKERGIYVLGRVREMNEKKAEEMGVDVSVAPANYKMSGRGWRRDAKVTLFDPDGKMLFDEDDEISIRGRSSRDINQKGFNIRPKKKGDKVFEGLFPDAGDILMLRTGSTEDVYKTNFRDALNQRIAKDFNVCSQSSLCCQVFLDGEYWGCYNLQEHLDPSFIASYYEVDGSNVNIVRIEAEKEAESGRVSDIEQYMQIERFAGEHDLGDDGNYAIFCDMVDIDSLIDYYIAQIFFANDDAYYGNYGLWRVRTPELGDHEDGKWRFILYDLDNTDGYAENAASSVDSFVDGSFIGYNADDDRFFAPLSENAQFRKRFRDRFNELLSSDLSYDNTGKILDEMEETYKGPMVNSLRRFYKSDATEEDYTESVDVVRNFLKKRGGYISEYLRQHMGD